MGHPIKKHVNVFLCENVFTYIIGGILDLAKIKNLLRTNRGTNRVHPYFLQITP